MSDGEYGFENLPLTDIEQGTTVLVTGPTHDGARDLGLRLLAGGPDEGVILVTTNQRARRIARECTRAGITLVTDRTAILDCVGDENQGVRARVLQVSGPSDLTGIGMRYADVCQQFDREGIQRVRTGLCSVSTLLSFGDLKTVSRFVHTLVGRIDSVDGIGTLLIDPSMHDDRTVSTLSQFCSGRIDVRRSDAGPELRVRGLPGQPRDWTPFDPASD